MWAYNIGHKVFVIKKAIVASFSGFTVSSRLDLDPGDGSRALSGRRIYIGQLERAAGIVFWGRGGLWVRGLGWGGVPVDWIIGRSGHGVFKRAQRLAIKKKFAERDFIQEFRRCSWQSSGEKHMVPRSKV